MTGLITLRFLSLLALLVFMTACSVSASAPQDAPTVIASDRIAGVIEKYRQEIPQLMQKNKVPGLAIAVVDDQNILWAEGFGYTDWDRQVPVTPGTLFSIQSMSKSFTATAAMFAAQDGLVDLDAPITTYLPDFHVNSIFEEHPEQKMTLRILLSHTAGFAHDTTYGGNFDSPEYSFEKHIASISENWLMFPVGSRYSYSNVGIDLAGYILQVRSGMPFVQYVQEKVLRPLDMQGSTLEVSRVRAASTRAIGHTGAPLRPPVDFLLIPSGGVWTTAQDMARYLQFHIQKGVLDGKRLLREDLAETMYTPPNAPAYHYALGIVVDTRNTARHIQHGGGGFGFNSSMAWYPELKLGAVVLMNSHTSDSMPYDINENILDEIISSASKVYAQRVESATQIEPAYPPSEEETTLSDNGLQVLIASKALPGNDPALQRRKAYAGTYIITFWNIPIYTCEVLEANGRLFYTNPNPEQSRTTVSLTEVEPGLFFDSEGNLVDLRGPDTYVQNIRVIKANTRSRPFQIAFYAVCGFIFLLTLFFWPAHAIYRRIRRKKLPADASASLPGKHWLLRAEILAWLASLTSLICLAIVALLPNLVSIPWPRPFTDLLWWQSGVFYLPFASLLMAAGAAMLAGLSIKNRQWNRAAPISLLLVVLAVFACNWALLT